MRAFLLLCLALLFGAAVASFALQDAGYLLLVWGDWRVEIRSLVLGALVVVLVLVALTALLRVAFDLGRAPGRTLRWHRRRRNERIDDSLHQGYAQLAAGRWRTAEHSFLVHAGKSGTPLLHYLGAAEAARRQGAPERSERYFAQAYSAAPQNDLAIGIAEARALHEAGDSARARDRLQVLDQRHPDEDVVLRMLHEIDVETGNWTAVLQRLPRLHRRAGVPAHEIDQLEQRAHAGRLRELGAAQDLAGVQAHWAGLARRLQREPALVLEYVRALERCQQQALAAEQAAHCLDRTWDAALVREYGLIESGDAGSQLERAEGWLGSHRDDPVLLLTLGRLCRRQDLYARARAYLEDSVARDASPEACRELGELLLRMDDPRAACGWLVQGLTAALAEHRGGSAGLPARVEA